MKREILLSVIIPAYNVEEYLPQCINSVLQQTYRNLEIVLIDDGSTDLTGEICDRYAKEDPRIKVLHQANAGVSAARNLGIAHAMGDFITFIDSDDWLNENIYEDCMGELKEHEETDILEFGYSHIVDGKSYPISGDEEIILDNTVLKEYVNGLKGIQQLVWNKIFRADIVKSLHFRVGRRFEDDIFVFETLAKCKYYRYIPVLGYNYRRDREDSFMVAQACEKVCDLFLNIEDLTEKLEREGGELTIFANTLMVQRLMFFSFWGYDAVAKRTVWGNALLPFIRKARHVPFISPDKFTQCKRRLFLWFPKLYVRFVANILPKSKKFIKSVHS